MNSILEVISSLATRHRDSNLNDFAVYMKYYEALETRRKGFVLEVCPNCKKEIWKRIKKTKKEEVYKCIKCGMLKQITSDQFKNRKVQRIKTNNVETVNELTEKEKERIMSFMF